MLNTSQSHRGSEVVDLHIPCPSCPSSDAYCTYSDGHGYCFSCKYLYLPNHKEEFILSDTYTYEYLPYAGISKETMKLYDVKTKVDAEGKPVSLGFRYKNDSFQVKSLVIPKSDPGHFFSIGEIAKGGLFGTDKFSAGAHKYCTITEGAKDALSLHQVLDGPVYSIQSSGSGARDCTVDRSLLNSYERIYLCFDNDAPGRQATADVARLFDYNKVFVVKLSKRKDANEFLVAGEGDELRKIWWRSKQYMPADILSDFTDFETILDKPKKIGIPYPFKILNPMTYGIRTGETVLITAQEKVGKTEIMHFIEHQILKETSSEVNVGAIFLEEEPQRHLHALAGIEIKAPIHLPDRDYPRSQVVGALKEVIQVDGRLHLYSHFGSDDPMVFLDTVRFLATSRNCRYILLDHISMVVSGIINSSGDTKLLDYLSTRLEMMVKELDIALIMVSHVNDFGQTRGSRWLTKICDLQINATRDMMSTDPIVRSTMNLSIPISRYPGITGNVGSIIFDRDTYTFSEIGANDDQQGSDLRSAA